MTRPESPDTSYLQDVGNWIILVGVDFAVVELRVHDDDEMCPHVVQSPAEIAGGDGDLNRPAVEQLLHQASLRLGKTLDEEEWSMNEEEVGNECSRASLILQKRQRCE